MFLVSGIYHNVPLSPFNPAAPISLAVEWNVILRKQNNTLPSVEGYSYYRSALNNTLANSLPLQNS
jgi:hypothetical protein